MAISGESYGMVAANTVNGGISTLAFSGGEEIMGNETLTIQIRWIYDQSTQTGGITGQGWFIGKSYSPINGPYNSDEAFNQYLSGIPTSEAEAEINGYFSSWSDTDKADFWNAERAQVYNCLDIIVS